MNKELSSHFGELFVMVHLPDIIIPKVNHFGLSIERTVIRGVEVNAQKIPVKMAEVELPETIFVDSIVAHPQALVEAMKQLFIAGKFSVPYVAVCFPEIFAFTRGHTLPIIPIDEVGEAVSWKAKDLFPFPKEEIYFDWKIINKTQTEYQVNVVAVQKKVLDSLMNALTLAGLKPLRFEPDATALSRLVKLSKEEQALLIEVNPHGAYMTLVEGEKSLFTTAIPLSKDDTPATYVANIDRTLIDISTFYRNKGILKEGNTNVFVTGSLASPQWLEHCHKLLPYPVKILDTAINKPGFNKAYASAIENIAPPSDENSINLLPTDTQTLLENQRHQQFYKILLFRASVILGILTVCLVILNIIIALKRQQLELEAKTARLDVSSRTVDLQKLLQLNAQAKNVVTLAPLRKTPKEAIDGLLALLSEDISVTQFDYNDARLTVSVQGVAKTRNALLSFKDRIEKSDQFTGVTLPLASLESPTDIGYSLSFYVKLTK